MIANYAAAIVGAIAPLMAVPYYLAGLGVVNWGLVSFAMTLATVMGIVEIGISQRLVRDLALLHHEDKSICRAVTRVVEVYYLGAAAVVAAAVAALAPWISTRWLHLPEAQADAGRYTVYFCAVLIATQLVNAAHRSHLVATGRQVALSVQTILFSLLKHGGGVLAVRWCEAGLAGLYCYLGVVALLDVLSRHVLVRWERQGVVPLQARPWRHAASVIAAGMKVSMAVVIGALALQLDRLYLSTLGDLAQLGTYSIAAVLAYGALQLTTPLMSALAPALAVSSRDPAGLDARCLRLLRLTLVIIATGGVAYVVCGPWLLARWLRNPDIQALHAPLSLLLIGTALNMVYQVGYQRWIALGFTRIIFLVNVCAFALSALLTPFAIAHFGMPGAAVAWVTFNLVGLSFQIPWFIALFQSVLFTAGPLPDRS